MEVARENHAKESDGKTVSTIFRASAASALLLLAGLAGLAGCQGVSTTALPAQLQQNGSLSLGSLSLDFGSVNAGSSKTLTVTATNSGTTSVTISSAPVSTS